MSWTEHLTNPEAIQQLYSSIPALNAVRLSSLKVVNSPNPTLEIYIAIAERPDQSTPRRWPKEFTEVSIHLRMLTVRQLLIPCWQFNNTVKVSITSNCDDEKRFQAVWPSGQAMICVADIITVASIEGF